MAGLNFGTSLIASLKIGVSKVVSIYLGSTLIYSDNATVPDVITTLSGTSGDTVVDLTWSAPNDGGDTITSYNIYKDAVLDQSVTTLDAKVAGLINDTAYAFTVTAVNSVGESAISNEISVTPSGYIVAETFINDISKWTSYNAIINNDSGSTLVVDDGANAGAWSSGVILASIISGLTYEFRYSLLNTNNTVNLVFANDNTGGGIVQEAGGIVNGENIITFTASSDNNYMYLNIDSNGVMEFDYVYLKEV